MPPLARRRVGAIFARPVRGPEERTAMTLRVGGAVIEVQAGFDAGLLRALIAALEAPAS